MHDKNIRIKKKKKEGEEEKKNKLFCSFTDCP